MVGVSNGSIQFAAYEDIKARRAKIKRRRIEQSGGTWRREDEKLVSLPNTKGCGDGDESRTVKYRIYRRKWHLKIGGHRIDVSLSSRTSENTGANLVKHLV